MSFDIIGNNTVVRKFNNSFQQIWSSNFNAYLGSDYFVRYHLNKENEEMPFFIGSVSPESGISHYYINCFTPTGLSVEFINTSSGNFDGSIMGNTDEFNIDASYSSLVYLHDDLFSMSRFHSKENYIHPNLSINVNENTHSSQLGDNYIHLPELATDAKVSALKDIFNNEELVVFASTTKTNQVVLYFFNPESSELVKTHYLGHTNPVEVATIKRGSDNSLLILGKTWITGRFQRIILYKLSMDELSF